MTAEPMRTRPRAWPMGWNWPGRAHTILDVGGESTRPYSDAVSEAEELARVLPVVEGLVAAGTCSVHFRGYLQGPGGRPLPGGRGRDYQRRVRVPLRAGIAGRARRVQARLRAHAFSGTARGHAGRAALPGRGRARSWPFSKSGWACWSGPGCPWTAWSWTRASGSAKNSNTTCPSSGRSSGSTNWGCLYTWGCPTSLCGRGLLGLETGLRQNATQGGHGRACGQGRAHPSRARSAIDATIIDHSS